MRRGRGRSHRGPLVVRQVRRGGFCGGEAMSRDGYALIEGDQLAALRFHLATAQRLNHDWSVVMAAVPQHFTARMGSLIDDVMCTPETWEAGE